MIALTQSVINSWADDMKGPVALHLKQKLLPVEGEGAVIFPPTYADIGYNIDTLSDGTKVATIDSAGSQANRMEPIFKAPPYSDLVPQVEIVLHEGTEEDEPYQERRSLLDLAHRSADAVVHSSPTLAPLVSKAYSTLRRRGDAAPLCSIAPTSLVFGAWDSRGGSGEKRPRLVKSVIRAWGVDQVSSGAQFNSVWKHLSEDQKDELEKEAKAKKVKLSEKGFADAPATFRKVSASAAKQMPEFRNGSPNPERRLLGGVYVAGDVEREVTVNLIALRQLSGSNPQETTQVRRYILALTLIAATAELDLFLRSGCILQIPDADTWRVVPRRGPAEELSVPAGAAESILLPYAREVAAPFKKRWPATLVHSFDLKEAKKLLAKKDEDEAGEE